MSHIHLPDGILPFWLWISGYAIAAVLLIVFWRPGKARPQTREFALMGVFSAIMILVIMIEIPPFSFHFNLSVVTGIILGPRLSVLAALVVNTILALIGHGGLTVVGWNSAILSVEMISGYYVFRLLTRLHVKLPVAAFGATFIGLALGTASGYEVIVAASPWIDRRLSASAGIAEALPYATAGIRLDLGRLALIMFGVGAIGWIVEGILSAVILRYVNRIYPGSNA